MGGLHVKRGDEVVVLAGAHKGKRGRVIHVDPQRQRVLVEGVNLIKRHMRKSRQHPQGGIIEREGPIHASNVMRADVWEARRARQTVPKSA
ncbi:MAG: 50S ribosomal protein L24 [Verrucomicrobiota bacterium]|nr:50S ribosomal protein L24 [Limisphaera sp.]MDW8382708.1 50S ribosomal protein L24 [Verrucomicrobiota bacterium]